MKNTGSYTDWEGNTESYEDWQIYAIDKSGYVDWGKTIWTESIKLYETSPYSFNHSCLCNQKWQLRPIPD